MNKDKIIAILNQIPDSFNIRNFSIDTERGEGDFLSIHYLSDKEIVLSTENFTFSARSNSFEKGLDNTTSTLMGTIVDYHLHKYYLEHEGDN